MHSIYNYILQTNKQTNKQTNHVARVYSVAAVL
jgi:hypothetical protein